MCGKLTNKYLFCAKLKINSRNINVIDSIPMKQQTIKSSWFYFKIFGSNYSNPFDVTKSNYLNFNNITNSNQLNPVTVSERIMCYKVTVPPNLQNSVNICAFKKMMC